MLMTAKGATISIIIDKRILGRLIHSLEWRHKKYGWIEYKEKFGMTTTSGKAIWRVFLYSAGFPAAWDRHLAKLDYEGDRITDIVLIDTDSSGWQVA